MYQFLLPAGSQVIKRVPVLGILSALTTCTLSSNLLNTPPSILSAQPYARILMSVLGLPSSILTTCSNPPNGFMLPWNEITLALLLNGCMTYGICPGGHPWTCTASCSSSGAGRLFITLAPAMNSLTTDEYPRTGVKVMRIFPNRVVTRNRRV